MMQSIPPIAWLGIAIIWFGLTDLPSVFIIVLSTKPMLCTNLYEGFMDQAARADEMPVGYFTAFAGNLIDMLLSPPKQRGLFP